MTGFAIKRRHVWWTVAGFLVAVCAVIAGGTLYIWYSISVFGACKNVVLGSIPSPDGNKSVVIFRKECGATVPYSMQASIAPAGRAFSAEQNPAFFIIAGTPDIIATWSGSRTVEIALIPGGGRIFRGEPSVGDIKIEYK